MLIFQTALPCEAKPLIDAFQLKRIESHHLFPIYQGNEIVLIISGIGKVAAGSAVGYLQGIFDTENSVWYNLGIAGHRSLAIGTGILAHKIIDAGSFDSYYPTFISPPNEKTSTVCTVDQPEKTFIHDFVYDMEASGFIQMALKTSSSELIRSHKIISDHLEEKIDFKPSTIHKLIEPHVDKIRSNVETLLDLRLQIRTTAPPIEEFLQKWHFTQTQKHQLAKIVSQYMTLEKQVLTPNDFKSALSAKDVLDTLKKQLQSQTLII